MFYRIRNHLFNLDRVIDIHIEGEFLIVNMDKIQLDLPTL